MDTKPSATKENKKFDDLITEDARKQIKRAQEKQQSASAISKNPDSEGHNDSVDTRSDPSGNSQISKQNMIFISGLPLNMSEQRLFNALRRVFSTVGDIKINQQTKEACIYVFRKEDTSSLSDTATITFEEEETIQKAIEEYNGKCVPILNGAQIRVKKSEMTPPPMLKDASEDHILKIEQIILDPGVNTQSIPSEITVWIQFEECQARKETLHYPSDIDDLKKVAVGEQGGRDLYEAYYQNQQLGSGERVPLNTVCNQPVLLRKKTKLQVTETNTLIPKGVRKCSND